VTDYTAQVYFIPWDKYLFISEIMSDPRSLVYPEALIHATHQFLIDCSPNKFAEGGGGLLKATYCYSFRQIHYTPIYSVVNGRSNSHME
jgi:hypothetical protein